MPPFRQSDVAGLVQCCRLLSSHLSLDLSAAIRQDLLHLVPPDVIASSVAHKLCEEPTPEFAAFLDEVAERVRSMKSLASALAKLIEMLRVSGWGR